MFNNEGESVGFMFGFLNSVEKEVHGFLRKFMSRPVQTVASKAFDPTLNKFLAEVENFNGVYFRARRTYCSPCSRCCIWPIVTSQALYAGILIAGYYIAGAPGDVPLATLVLAGCLLVVGSAMVSYIFSTVMRTTSEYEGDESGSDDESLLESPYLALTEK